MSLFNNPSAGVYVQEIDLSQRIQGVSTSIGAVVGRSRKGAMGRPVLITDSKKFIDMFGVPDVSMGYFHYASLTFLLEAQRLWCVRVPDESTYAGVAVGMLGAANQIATYDPTAGIPYLAPEEGDTIEPTNGSPSYTVRTDPERLYLPDYNFDTLNDVELFTLYARDPGSWGNNISVRIYPNTNADRVPSEKGTFYVEVFNGDTVFSVEKFLVSMEYRLDGYGNQMYIEDAINLRSIYIRAKMNPLYVPGPLYSINTVLPKTKLAGGIDLDVGAINKNLVTAQILQGWQLFRDPEEIDVNILIQAGYSSDTAIPLAMDEICQFRMDCVSILDIPRSYQDTVENTVFYRRSVLNLNSSYSAIYSPDVYVTDSYNAKRLYVPPSGHVAAVYAKTDRLTETWFAPAGMIRGDLDVLGVYKIYNQGDRDYFEESQVNPIRVFYGQGIKVWGQDTLQAKASSLSNMSVRRLMNFLEKSISIAALYSVFEPNTHILRRRLAVICENFLKPIAQRRGIYGYAVVCDESNNTNDIIANGDLILDVYIDPVLPVKRIHLNAIVARTGGIQFAVEQMYGGS